MKPGGREDVPGEREKGPAWRGGGSCALVRLSFHQRNGPTLVSSPPHWVALEYRNLAPSLTPSAAKNNDLVLFFFLCFCLSFSPSPSLFTFCSSLKFFSLV